MQRPISATSSLPYASAKAALSGIRKNLIYRGLTRDPYSMCAEIGRYGLGWAVYVGFQPSTNLAEALEALQANCVNPLDGLLDGVEVAA